MEHFQTLPEGAFSSKVSEGRGKALQKNGEMQKNNNNNNNHQETNKRSITKYFHKAGKLFFEKISFFGVDLAENFFDVEFYSAWITLFGIYYQNQGTNQITELYDLGRKGLTCH